ncbi:MAG: NADPH-dependent glutamate synthase [bacterium]|nr:NADPH-dependent glutamate synthase [bacterium]
MPAIKEKRTKVSEQKPELRAKNFNEVSLGYSDADAKEEAGRCLQCKKPTCKAGCPVEVDIPEFIKFIQDGDFKSAISKIKEKNNLPAICGRVCPQESQCEKYCVLGKKYEPVAIGRLERFAADHEISSGVFAGIEMPKAKGKKVAVIGSGPAGLSAAADLVRMGYTVHVFESLHDTGGVLRYGIPEFRLPKKILDIEVENIRKLGVEFKLNMVIGKILTLDELFKDNFKAVFLGTGAGLPHFLHIPGENFNGVYSANEFLTRVNLMKAYRFPEYDTPVAIGENVSVIGAGNVAMDSARVALRLGAKKVSIVYRRSEKEMPARQEEIEHAKEEGINFEILTYPTRVLADINGSVEGMECIRMELGEPDASGRRSPVPIKGSEFIMKMNTVISAIGQSPNPLLFQATPALKTTERGTVVANENGATVMPGVFAGGDVVTGAATVIKAMGAGKAAARAINEFLK